MRLSLRSKIVGGFGLLVALIIILGWVTLSLFSSLRDVQRRVFNEAIPGLVAVDEIVRSYTAQSAAIRGFLIQNQPTLLGQYRSEVETAHFWEERAAELFTAEDESELLARLVAAGDSFHQLIDERVVPVAQEGRRSAAFRLLGQDGTPLINDIENLGILLREAQDRVVAQTEAQLRDQANQALLILVLVLIGALGLGLGVAIVLPRRLSANLLRLVEATRAIGRGDFEQEIDIHSRDEVEELGARFREMQSGLKRLQQLALQDRELEIAGSIQQNLLQRTIPELEGIRIVPLQRQANLVGGDWYDIDVRRGTLTVAVADCSGKGIAAALMATVALSVLRAERRIGLDHKRAIERTNDALLEATDPDSFTTMIYASIDPHTGEARWLNMGHPAPYLLRATSSDEFAGGDGAPRGAYVEGPRNNALGWFESPGLTESGITLGPGDRLILYTDGFLEAKSPDGEVFGEHRLGEAIGKLAPLDSHSIGEELVREVERFAAGKLDDDLTMLVVEFVGAPAAARPERSTEESQWHSKR